MRVPLGWLRDYVDIDLTPEQLAERLTLLGMEVKGLERWGADWQHVVVGRLLTVERHPRADRLSLTTVDVGAGAPLSIVCGATNIAPGQHVPVALPGAVLPGGRRIERVEKMGVVSNGMLCSGDELALTSDADGILILPGETQVGRELADLFGDIVLDVDVKPNRGDVLSLLGLAREVSAATGAPVRPPVIELSEHGAPTADRLAVDVLEPELCPRFVGRLVTSVTVGASPDLVQMRLRAAGQRPISNVVDASNYVMLELGKPIHTFDAAAIHDGRIIVRRALAGERLETLDHVVRDLDEETLLIADPVGPSAIAGIMGGASSEVSGQTRDVIVESAIFEPVSIRRTGQRYALRSEASLRFEKGQEFRNARIGADRTAQLLASWAGGSVAPGRVDTHPEEPERSRVAFRPARVGRLLGAAIPASEQRLLLARVGIETAEAPPGTRVVVSVEPHPLVVDPWAASETEAALDGPSAPAAPEVFVALVPTWRRDLHIEADVAEEVARVRGYERTPGSLPDTPMPEFRPSPLQVRDRVRRVLAGAGLSEVVTHALVSPGDVERFRASPDPAGVVDGEADAGGEPIIVTNPLSSQHSMLRQRLLGSLLEVVRSNIRQGREDVAVFEIGKGYGRVQDRPHEWWRLGFALTGAAAPRAWNRPLVMFDLDDGKGILEILCHEAGLESVSFEPLLGTTRPSAASDGDQATFHPGRSALATARVAGLHAVGLRGRIGEVHPRLLDELEIRADRVVLCELSLRGLTRGQLAPVRAAPVPRVPAVERDLAIVVADDVPAAAIAARIRDEAGDLLRSVRLFDVYPMPGGGRSLAYRVVLQAPDRTLTDEEIDGLIAGVVAGLERLGGRLRT
ncbi:MAG: phenylalanine--tRNA ligase subunit beta [Chloroflexi bacterium]|nr:phenylalanine--tRNA ligase subunit beta [Chloroflexota bacterium]